MKKSKKFRNLVSAISLSKIYDVTEAIEISKKYKSIKFDESIDISVMLGIDSKKTDQLVRGVLNLPKGIGKKVKVAVFASGDDLEIAKNAGAEIVGSDDLVETIKTGKIEFDKCISTPEMMAKVGTLGQILGPKGMMPNPKLGTVTKNIIDAVKNVKSGQVEYKTDKGGLVHVSLGKLSFSSEEIVENIKFFFKELNKNKPSGAKGTFIKKIFLSSTMGPGLKIDLTSVM